MEPERDERDDSDSRTADDRTVEPRSVPVLEGQLSLLDDLVA